MAAEFRLRIITPEKQILDEQVVSLEAKAVEGWLGVWANHAPMVAILHEGDVKWRDTNDKDHLLHISGGILDVGENEARVIADGLSEPPKDEPAKPVEKKD